MNIILTMLVIGLNIALLIKDRTKGLILYGSLALVYPLTNVWGYKISYEILGWVFVIGIDMLWLVLKKSFVFYKEYWLLVFIGVFYCAATLFSKAYWQTEIMYITLLGMLRYLTLIVAFTQKGTVKDIFSKVLKTALGVNLASIIIQVFIPNSYKMFHFLYEKEAGIYWVVEKTWLGVYKRCFGTFTSPTILAYLALIATIFFFMSCFI